LDWVRPRGGSVGFPRLLADVPIEQFAEELVRRTGTLILPGGLFSDSDNRFRIGFGRSNMPRALARLEDFASQRFGSRRAGSGRRGGAAGPGPAADLSALEARLWSVIKPYRDRLEAGSIYGMSVLRRPGAGAHEFFAGVRPGPRNVTFHLKPLYDHPALLDSMSPHLRKHLTGKQSLNFSAVDNELMAELAALTARAFELYMAGRPEGTQADN